MLNIEENIILEFVKNKPKSSSKYIFDNINSNKSYATIKRQLSNLVDKRLLEKIGKGKVTK